MRDKKLLLFLTCKNKGKSILSFTNKLKLPQLIVFKAEKKILFYSRALDLTKSPVSDS